MHSYTNFIHKKNRVIPINKNFIGQTKTNLSPSSEYSLTQNFFDPSKSSPPNDFMIKLQMRMNRFTESNYKVINDDKRDSE
jgi:hypothetical protein